MQIVRLNLGKINIDDLPHPLHVVRVVASIKAGCPALLGEMVEALSQVFSIHNLSMADPVGLAGVYCPPGAVLTPDAGAGIGPAPGSVTAGVLVVRNIVTGVDGNIHGLSVGLKSVIFRTPVSCKYKNVDTI